MDESAKLLLTVAIPTVTVLVGILVNNRQLESARGEMNARFDAVNAKIDALRGEMNARFDAAHERLLRVEGVLDARLKHLEETLSK